MDTTRIQNAARDLQLELWGKRDLLCQTRQLTAMEVLDPDAAAYILGLEYLEVPSLGDPRFAPNGERYRAAGLINFPAKRITISTEFRIPVRRFTAAHEIGHWLLHQGTMPTQHRDLPVDGSKPAKTLIEQEADYFAACFLMPARLLEHKFKEQFGVDGQFPFNDATCFHLNPGDPETLLRASPDSLDRELALARCRRFNWIDKESLADQFRVSEVAMARRLRELQLVRWP